ncbi:MAG: copper resistance protein CopC [bacterium]|nr:copper resistance protein CopC [bacterium]
MKNTQLYIIGIFVMLFGFVGQAFAHATPVRYEPASSSVSQSAFDRVRIFFSERIEPTASDITVLGPDGTAVSTGNATVNLSDVREFGVGLKDAGQGTYTVSWQVVSADDGHFTKGAFIFSVGKETAAFAETAGQIQVQHITSIPHALVMWIELVGQALLLGALVVMVMAFALAKYRKEISPDVADVTARRTRMFVVCGAVFIFVGVVLLLILKTLDLEVLRSTAFFPTLRVFVRTLDGMHAILRAALALLFASVFFLWPGKNEKQLSVREIVLTLLVVGMALSRARVSHSAATAFFPAFSIVMTAIQLFAKELWVGGLVALTCMTAMMKKRGETISEFFSVTLFSQIASVAFGITGVTGAYIVWLDLKKPEYLFSSEWGGRFIILVMFACAFVALRMVHQVLIEKKLLRAVGDSSRSASLFRLSRYVLCTEAMVGLALLLVTSFLIITTPPYPPTQFGFERHAVSQGADILFAVDTYEPDKFLVVVSDPKGNPPIETTVSLTNQEKGIGPIVVSIEKRFPGGYVFPRNAFSLPGAWQVNIVARREGAFDATGSFSLTYPQDIDGSRIDPEHRSFGLFEVFLLIVALLTAGMAFILYRMSRGVYGQCKNIAQEREGERTRISATTRSWLVALAAVIMLFGIIWISYNTLIKTDFQKLCERDGNFWLQAIPMRDGAALSPDTVTGCTLNLGLYHFADDREYRFFMRPRQSMAEIATIPVSPIAGKPTQMQVQLSMVEKGRKAGPIQDIGIYHDRLLHMIIIGEDLKTFAHIHAEDLRPITAEMRKTGIFSLRHTFPKAGRYAIVVNYIQGGKELSQELFVNVGGCPMMKKNADVQSEVKSDTASAKDFDGYRVTFDAPENIVAGEMAKLTYIVEKDGKELTDLDSYLGAAMHFAIVRADLSGRIIHTHGQPYLPGSVFFQQLAQNYVSYHSHFVPDRFGPKMQARIVFPQSGSYEVFGEFKHDGKVITTVFTVNVK